MILSSSLTTQLAFRQQPRLHLNEQPSSTKELHQLVQRQVTAKATDKEKLPRLGYTTGRNSYWLANVARFLDAILTPGQRIERERP